jgi:hypothetical protein
MSYPYIYTAGTLARKGKLAGLPGILVYPNPARGAANLHLSGFTGAVTVTVTDMAGKTVWQQDKLNNGNYRLPLNNIAAGVYIITVKDRMGPRSLKFIKAE